MAIPLEGHLFLVHCFSKRSQTPMTPRFIESKAELGTMTMDPFSFNPSYSIFIPRNAVLLDYSRIVRWLCEFLRYFCFCSTKNYPGFSLSFCLCLLAHCISKRLGNDNIPDTHRLTCYSPGICICIQGLLKIFGDLLSFLQKIG